MLGMYGLKEWQAVIDQPQKIEQLLPPAN